MRIRRGMTYWQAYLAAGHSYAQGESSVASSAEAFALAGGSNAAWVGVMYQKLLERNAATSEISYWTGKLNSGDARNGGCDEGIFAVRRK